MTCRARCGWSYWCVTRHREICSILPLSDRVAYCRELIEKDRRIQRTYSENAYRWLEPEKNKLYFMIHPEAKGARQDEASFSAASPSQPVKACTR